MSNFICFSSPLNFLVWALRKFEFIGLYLLIRHENLISSLIVTSKIFNAVLILINKEDKWVFFFLVQFNSIQRWYNFIHSRWEIHFFKWRVKNEIRTVPSFISLYRFHLFGIHILIVISQHACNFLTVNTSFSTYPVMTILQLCLFFLVDHPLVLQL